MGMIIARTEEEKNLINKINPIYGNNDGFIIDHKDRVYLKRVLTSFETSKMTYAPDYYVEERIAEELLKKQLDTNGLNNIGYHRIMNTTLEEIFLYDLNMPHLINLHTNKMKHGLYDEDNKLVETGMMRSFFVPSNKSNIEDTYKHIEHNLEKGKQYGIVRAQKSQEFPDMNVVAIFDIVSKQDKS